MTDIPDGDPVLNPEMAHERIAAWRGRIEQLAADTRSMSEQFAQVAVTAEDAGGIVTVTVDSSGALADLRLSSRAQRVAPDALARTIMKTVADARAKLAGRAQQIIAETLGETSTAGQAIAARVSERLQAAATAAEPPDRPDWG